MNCDPIQDVFRTKMADMIFNINPVISEIIGM